MNVWDKLTIVVMLLSEIMDDIYCPVWLAGLCAGFIAGANSWVEKAKAQNAEAERLKVFDDWLKARNDER